jgi:general stress protein YciG
MPAFDGKVFVRKYRVVLTGENTMTSTTKGGTPEQHARAGHAGGEATATTHDHEFYETIGRKGGEARAAALHHQAASHHEAAAHHHRQAAYHHSKGSTEEAKSHAEQAHAHSQHAHELARNALGQFVSTKGGG